MPPPAEDETFSPIRWETDHLRLLDQTLLPREEVWLECRAPEDVATAIRRLSVRGAPAIGVAAAYGLVLGVLSAPPGRDLGEHFRAVVDLLGSTRPTAVNLRWALEQGQRVFEANAGNDCLAWIPGQPILAALPLPRGQNSAILAQQVKAGPFSETELSQVIMHGINSHIQRQLVEIGID